MVIIDAISRLFLLAIALTQAMDLDQQLKVLTDEAPQYGVPASVMQAVTPVLKGFTTGLQHLEYYIPQSLDGGWVLTTLSNRTQPQLEKRVVYAFATLQDAANQGNWDLQTMAMAVPVTYILFQLFSLQEVDSIVFMDTPGSSTGTEIRRSQVQKAIQTQLQQLAPQSRHVPPDIA